MQPLVGAWLIEWPRSALEARLAVIVRGQWRESPHVPGWGVSSDGWFRLITTAVLVVAIAVGVTGFVVPFNLAAAGCVLWYLVRKRRWREGMFAAAIAGEIGLVVATFAQVPYVGWIGYAAHLAFAGFAAWFAWFFRLTRLF
ncbi:MAG: hypothetical protein QM831_14740 [Kofleriaceae bacterium]